MFWCCMKHALYFPTSQVNLICTAFNQGMQPHRASQRLHYETINEKKDSNAFSNLPGGEIKLQLSALTELCCSRREQTNKYRKPISG